MRRKIIVLLQATAVLLLFFLIARLAHIQPSPTFNIAKAKSTLHDWTHSSSEQAIGSKGNDSLVAPSKQPETPVTKKTNDTLLAAAPPYVKAILAPDDNSFPRLECPAPKGDRYGYLGPQGNKTNAHVPGATVKYFFALDLHQCASLLPRLLGSVIESIRFLGPQNCALSVVEGRSTDGTFEILNFLREEMERMGVQYYLNTNEIDPKAEGGDRIAALSELRNQALNPLVRGHAGNGTDVTVVFINDVAICMEDILELIHQRHHQNADMTCAMDWTYVGPDPTFYDVWIARGMNGDTFFNIPPDGNWNSAWNLFWNNPDANQKLHAGKPFQVFSCWNGAVTFTAKPFVDHKITFRSAYEDECPQGEPKSFCKDMWSLGYGKIAVIPSVNLEYSDEAGKKIKAAKGYVSDFVGGGNNADELIEWQSNPPEKVKCIPNYENQHWRPWDEVGLNSTTP